MENQDKIEDLLRKAAQNAESKEFPDMNKVWSRVEHKLDNKVLVKKNKQWKKVAVAASVLLVISIVYQFLKPEPVLDVDVKRTVVSQDTINKVIAAPTNNGYAFTTAEKNETIIKPESKEILNNQINSPKTVAHDLTMQDSLISNKKSSPSAIVNLPTVKRTTEQIEMDKSTDGFLRRQIYQAVGVRHLQKEKESASSSQQPSPKAKPLVVIDGKKVNDEVIYGSNDKFEASQYDDENLESMVYLKEPLYIINGVHYSEEDLFGSHPTSPYAPLDQQEIEKIEILQGKEAIKKHGEKGRKGVVIIATKDGKPAVLLPKK
jgi:negative regulator of sigma E activity